jgi:phosphoglucomutase/phosphomannomutase
MDLLQRTAVGFGGIDVDARPKEQALEHLRRWLTLAEFSAYRPQIEWLITTQQWAGLLDRFYQILPFGTGGRRGAVGIGPNRMNLWTLGASVQGHCEYLKERFPGAGPLQVVLAYDVRQFEDQRKNYHPDLPNPVLHLSSKTFAHHAAAVYAANGIHAHIARSEGRGTRGEVLGTRDEGRAAIDEGGSSSPRPTPLTPRPTLLTPRPSFLATPELSYIIRRLSAHGGLNVSASHNPPDDNGGKFYDERGGQPVPPEDQIMADLVDQVTDIRTLSFHDAVQAGRVHFLDEELHGAYIDLCRKQSLVKPPRHDDELLIVFTPLHGVGSMTALEVLQGQGFRVRTVDEQMAPDGQFPNVTQTPNPEIPASMDRAKVLAESIHADLVLATDPDADRLGAMVPDRNGQFLFVDGHSLAALITHFKLAKLAELQMMPANPIIIKTLVTTGLVTRIARSYQAQVVENLLVGFKYVAEVLWQLEQNGSYEDIQGTTRDFVLACEESHGLLLTAQIRDKDAGASALLLAELALDQKRKGKSVLDYCESMRREFGYHANLARNLVMPGIEGKRNMALMLDRLRQAPPGIIAGLPVTRFIDLQDEKNWLGPFKGGTDRAARNFLIFHLGENAQIAMRPSGTEPKAKVYVEACSGPWRPGTADADWTKVCRGVDDLAQRLLEEFLLFCQSERK